MDTTNWQLGPLVVNQRGNKSYPISKTDGSPVKLKLAPTTAPFGAGNFNKDEQIKLNLDLKCRDEYLDIGEKIDAWAIKELSKIKKPEEVKHMYKSCITPHEKNGITYTPTMRTKIIVAGPNSIKCWNPDKTSREQPVDWKSCLITPIVTVKAIWMMSNQCGILLQAEHAIIEDLIEECPF